MKPIITAAILAIVTFILLNDYDYYINHCNKNIANHNKNNRKHKIKFSKSRVLYYSNHYSAFQLILSGDIESNPGPKLKKGQTELTKPTTSVARKSTK